ncbi:MAG: HEAT repeat domain-containing protein [Gemmatimonadaceae bacterium]
MPDSLRFADAYDELVRLCAAQSTQYAEQHALLRTAARAVQAGEVTMVTGPLWPTVNGIEVGGAVAAPDGLAARLWARGLQRLFVARDAEPADLLLLARALAGVPTGAADGAELQLPSVRLTPVSSDDGELPGADMELPAVDAPRLPPHSPFEPAPRAPTATSSMSEVPEETIVGDDDRTGTSGAPRPVVPMINTPIMLRTIVSEDKRDLPLDALLDLLDSVGTLPDWQRLPELNLILEELGRRAEDALRDGDSALLRLVMLAVLRATDGEQHPEAQLSFRMVRRRLLTSPYLRVITLMLPRLPDSREELLYLLGQAGEDGADAVIEQLIVAEASSDRRVYTNTLVRLKAGERSLRHMLADERWYVVRNAADLLGEMRVVGAEEQLLGALRHEDVRVRRSALGALARLGTTRALQAVQDALGASEPGVRAQAAAVLASTSWPYTVATVRRRLREEADTDVQLALVAALGRVASDDAVALLTELTEPPRMALFTRRPTPLRSVALQALVDAHTPAARAVVERLSADRDAELRRAARRALDHWTPKADD